MFFINASYFLFIFNSFNINFEIFFSSVGITVLIKAIGGIYLDQVCFSKFALGTLKLPSNLKNSYLLLNNLV